jgi:6-phosphogluconate dehydrogenase (decarboxylating)
MKYHILEAIKEGTEIISNSEYDSDYKNDVNEATQLLLQALKLVDNDD